MKTPANIVLFEEIGRVSVSTACLKECGPDEIVCETLYSTISPGTELRMLAGHYGTAGKFPFVPGYSSVGRIVSVGSDVAGWSEGDLINSRNTLPLVGVQTLYGAPCQLQGSHLTGN